MVRKSFFHDENPGSIPGWSRYYSLTGKTFVSWVKNGSSSLPGIKELSVVKLVDAVELKSIALWCVGSSPTGKRIDDK